MKNWKEGEKNVPGEEKKKSDLKVGDTIKCHDPDDMIDTMNELVKSGIETDFLYKKDGKEKASGLSNRILLKSIWFDKNKW